MAWTYSGRDSGISLFTACLKAGAPIDFRPGMRVLEVGCCESDWLERASVAWPDVDFVGVDWRTGPSKVHGRRFELVIGDVIQPGVFPAASFDAVVGISAIEHIGLGHYGNSKHEKDPKDPDGD